MAFWLIMILIYFNCALYLMDLYALVKKKTQGETIMVMFLPGTITIMGTVLFSLFLQIPANADLERVWTEAVCPGLWTELLCLAGLFMALWFLTWRLWRRKRENRFAAVRWIFSYSPDFLMVILLVAVGAAGLIAGADLPVLMGRAMTGLGYNMALYLFLYGVAALAFRIALMLLAGLTQLCSARVSHFPYQEGHNPTTSFLLYAVLCQNARMRGMLAFWIPALWFAGWIAGVTNEFELRVILPIFIVLAAMLYLLFALRPIADNMARFDRWGDRRQILTLFCREYFLEEPLIKNGDFTVTRHFLADERGMIEVYAFDMLANVKGGWMSDPKKGWVRQLSFVDGGTCVIGKDNMGAEEIFRYAKQYREMQELAGMGNAAQRLRPAGGEGLYHKLFRFVMVAMIVVFFLMYQTMGRR